MDPIYDLAKRLQRLQRQLTGGEPPGVPTGYLQRPEDGRLL